PPVFLSGLRTSLHRLNFIRDPIKVTRQLYGDYGPFIVLGPVIGRSPSKPHVLAADIRFNKEVLGAPAIWRPVGLVLNGPAASAQSRLRKGLVRISGKEHAHYRRLLAAPLRRASVDCLGARMAEIVDAELNHWPVGESIDLWALVQKLVQHLAFALLFGGDLK